MSVESLRLIKWLLIVAGCAMLYQPIGEAMTQSSPFSLLASFLIAYIGVAVAVLGVFGLVQRRLGEKLIGSSVFGRAEYFLGMGSGMVRFGCMLLVGLAVLNARYFSAKEIKDMDVFQKDVYGSHLFPTWQTAQAEVFEHSLTGPWIRKNLDFLLIAPTEPGGKEFHQREFVMP